MTSYKKEFQQQVSYADIRALYDEERTKHTPTRYDPKIHETTPLEVENMNAIGESLKQWGTSLVKTHANTRKDSPGAWGGRVGAPNAVKWVPLSTLILSETIPLTAFAAKTFFTYPDGRNIEELHLFLWRKIPKFDDPEVLMREFMKRNFYEEEIACIRMEIHGNELEITEPEPFAVRRYRDLGTQLLRGAEAFAQEKSNQQEESIRLLLPGRQLDTVCWALNQGYECPTEAENDKLTKVLNGDSSLALGEEEYFFTANTPPEDRNADVYSAQRTAGTEFAIALQKEFTSNTPSKTKTDINQSLTKVLV
jgi:hypothetical protein